MRKIISLSLLLVVLICSDSIAVTPILTIDTDGHTGVVRKVIFTNDGRKLISVSDDKTIRIWNISTGETERIILGERGSGLSGMIYAAALSPDESILAVGGWMGPSAGYGKTDLGTIRLIDFRTGEILRLLKGHTNVVQSLIFSKDGRKLISASGDMTAIIWDMVSGKRVQTLEGHRGRVNEVSVSPDGQMALTASDDKTLKLWSTNDGTLIRTMERHDDKVKTAKFTPNGEYILSGGWDKKVFLWNGKTGDYIKRILKQNRSIEDLSVSADSMIGLTGHGINSGLRINNVFHVPTGGKVSAFREHNNVVLATAISPDGTMAATAGGTNNEIYLWDINTGEKIKKFEGKGRAVWSTGFSEDGRGIAWGKTWRRGKKALSYGPLEYSFSLKNESGDFEIAMGRELNSGSGYRRSETSAIGFSIATTDGNIGSVLEVSYEGRVIHKIKRGPKTGYSHKCYSLTPTGLVAVSGGGNGYLAAYDTKSGRLIREFSGHTDDVLSVSVSEEGKYLLSGSADQTVKLWDIDSGKLLLSIFQATDDEWVAWTPQGYYASSVNGDHYAGWFINRGESKSALYYPASAFSKQFYSPELVAKYIETGGNIDRAMNLVNKVRPQGKKVKDVAVDTIPNILPPAVFFQLPLERDSVVTKGEVRVRGIARSLTDEPVTDIWILVNGRKFAKTRAIKLSEKSSKKITGETALIDVTIPLTEKENRISLVASNSFASSEPEIINVTWAGKKDGNTDQSTDIFKPDLYLLSIGISNYSDNRYSLDVAHNDAIGISDVFKKQEGKFFNKVNTRLLTNENAARDDVLDGLDWIIKESTQKDVSVIFVAGHGIKDQRGNYYFLPHDGDPERLRRTGVNWFDFQDVLSGLPSKVIFMVDTCHSGSVTGKRRGVEDMTDALRELVTTESGIVVMTASTGKEESVEEPGWGHGAFTKAVIEGLGGSADYNADSVVDLKELDLFVTSRVKQLTKGGQHPTTEIPKTMPNFPIVYLR